MNMSAQQVADTYERGWRAGERMGARLALSALAELFPNTIDDEAKAYVMEYVKQVQGA